jgi:translation initiation factor IF-2
MLASASDAIIGFNVRPAGNARQLADKEKKSISVTILLSMQQSMT